MTAGRGAEPTTYVIRQPRNRDRTFSSHISPSSQGQQVHFKLKFQSGGRLVFSCRILLPAHLHQILWPCHFVISKHIKLQLTVMFDPETDAKSSKALETRPWDFRT